MPLALWINSLADVLTLQYLTALFLIILLFSLPIIWLSARKIKASILKDGHLYYLRRFIFWEILVVIIVISLLLYHYPRL